MNKKFIIVVGYATEMIYNRISNIAGVTMVTTNVQAVNIEVSIEGADDMAIETTVETIKNLGDFVKSVTEKP